jgi:hypothetical protein
MAGTIKIVRRSVLTIVIRNAAAALLRLVEWALFKRVIFTTQTIFPNSQQKTKPTKGHADENYTIR